MWRRFRKTTAVLSFLVVTLSLGAVQPRTAVGQTGMEILPEADAVVSTAAPDANYGSQPHLVVTPSGWCDSNGFYGSTTRAFLRFDLSALPAYAVIEEARLQMTAFSGFAYGGDGTQYVHLTEDAWGESTITWNNQPGVTGDPVGSFWEWYGYPMCADMKDVRTRQTSIAPALLNAALADDKKISFRMFSPGYWVSWYSRDFADEALRPKLLITYSIPDGLQFESPLDPDTIPTVPAGGVLDIQFAWLQDGAPALDESVSMRVRNNDTGALLAAFTYGAGIHYDGATGIYSQPFDTSTYGVAAGTRLKVMVYMGGKLQGTAYADVQETGDLGA